MEKMLDGVRVLDITQAFSAPFATMHLADHGAEVIKVEPLGGEQARTWPPIVNDYSGYFATVNRNKKGIALNLKTEGGKEALRRLIAKSDVVVENFRVGVFERLGFTYESMQKIKPDIIYASLTGFGLEGPLAHRPTYDAVAQGESGIMSVNGTPETGPMRTGVAYGDNFSGTYFALAIMMALYNRSVTGKGSRVDVAMNDAMFASLENYYVTYSLTGKVEGTNVIMDQEADPYGVFPAKDGYFVLAGGSHPQFLALADLIGHPELKDDPEVNDFEKRRQNHRKPGGFHDLLTAWTRSKTKEELFAILEEADIPYGRVNSIKEAAESPQLLARNMIWEVYDPGFERDFKMTGTPLKFDREEDAPTKAAPLVGEDTEEILKDLGGYTEEDVAALRAEGAIK